MQYSFTCYGHENITSRHKTTLEFTKDTEIGLEGDCIVGVRADFDLKGIKEFIKSLKGNNKVTITIQPIIKKNNNMIINDKNNIKKNKMVNEGIIEKINAEINPNFNSGKEMVIRKTDFVSERTFAIRANKAAFELNIGLITHLKAGGKVNVCITTT